MRKLPIFAFVALACAAILAAPSVRAQGYQFLQQNCPSCVVTFGSLTASTSVTVSGTTSPQVKCSGAATCGVQSASGQALALDSAGGTSTASLGATNATTTTIGRSGQTTNVNGNVQVGAKVTKYNNVSTAGMGVPALYAVTPIAGVSTSTTGTSVASYTPGAQGLFEVGGHFEVTAWTSGNVLMNLVYTDCNGNSRNYAMFGETSTGSSSNAVAAVNASIGEYSQTICANPAAITLQSQIAGTATATYWGHIKQVN